MMVVMTMVGADLHRYLKTYPEVDMMSTDAGCVRPGVRLRRLKV